LHCLEQTVKQRGGIIRTKGEVAPAAVSIVFRCIAGGLGVTSRTLLLSVVLALAAIAWMHQASLVQTPGQIYAPVYLLSVPPVPAIFCLLLLVILAPVLPRLSRKLKSFSKQEMLLIYMVLVVAVPPVTFGVVSSMLPAASAANYFAAPDNNFQALADSLPKWFTPQNPEIIRTMYEGSPDGTIPWRQWAYPLAMWTGFMALLYFTGLCLVTIFRKQWSENERLRYPLLFIPLSIVEKEAPGSHTQFFRNPLVWMGIGIVVLHHALNIANAYNPAVMALKDRYGLGAQIFTEHPWTAYRGITFFHRPQVIGLAYFVPLDILFSGWFFFLLQPTLRLIADLFGFTASAGFPHTLPQSAGGYAGMTLILFWVARHEIAKMLRKAFGGDRSIDDSGEPMSHRAALIGALGGMLAIIIWVSAMGANWAHATAYFLMVVGFGLVYARVRAEAGIPTMWGYFGGHVRTLRYFLDVRQIIPQGSLSNLAVLTSFDWLTEGYFPGQWGYVAENQKLAEDIKIKPRIIVPVMMVAFVLGCVFAYYLILQSYYTYGAMVLHGGTTRGGYAIINAVNAWTQASSMVDTGGAPNREYAIAMISGAALTILLVLGRWRWLRLPFHPLGYISCIQYGYCLWGPFFVVWIIKGLVHRLGGARLYRQLMPFFLGLAFGDLLCGGITWILMALLGPDITAGYMVQFG
jgi:hypothetical protein